MFEHLQLPRRRPGAPKCAACGRSLAGERLPVRDLDRDGRLRAFHQVCALKRDAG
jgi:hypothetical protein